MLEVKRRQVSELHSEVLSGVAVCRRSAIHNYLVAPARESLADLFDRSLEPAITSRHPACAYERYPHRSTEADRPNAVVWSYPLGNARP